MILRLRMRIAWNLLRNSNHPNGLQVFAKLAWPGLNELRRVSYTIAFHWRFTTKRSALPRGTNMKPGPAVLRTNS